MKTMYYANKWAHAPTPVEVVSETAKMVVVREKNSFGASHDNRRSKVDYFDTWEQCRQAMADEVERKMKAHQHVVHQCSTRLGQLRALKEPS